MVFEGADFHSAVAKTADEAQKIIEEKFEYIRDFNHVNLFGKKEAAVPGLLWWGRGDLNPGPN